MAGVGSVDRAGGMISGLARAQYAAFAQMRWRMLANSLRTRQGSFELGARIITTVFFSTIGLGAGLGLGFAAWSMAARAQWRLLPLLLWPVLVIWQIIPVMAASFQENIDLRDLLRFPMSFSSFLSLYLFYGLFDISTILGGICLTGIWVGLTAARPGLLLPAALTLVLFAVFNTLLTRMIFAWIDRWLAQRRTREILSGVFLLLLLLVQLLNPALHRFGQDEQFGQDEAVHHRHHHDHPSGIQIPRYVEKVQNVLPPGIAANAIHAAADGQVAASAGFLGGLILSALVPGILLSLRLRAEYRGENLGEGSRRAERKVERTRRERRWLEGSGPIGAVVEKELRYLSRSGVMLYSLFAPLIILFIFGKGSGGGSAVFAEYALPTGAAYAFLGLTRLIYNSLGGEGAGIQLYFQAPTPFRKIMLAKNLVHIALFCGEMILVCGIVFFRFGVPRGEMLAITFSWLLFALPVQLAMGNIFSITLAYRMTLTRLSREQGAVGNGLLGLLIQLLLVAIGAAVILSTATSGHSGWAVPIFLLLAAGGITAWQRVLAATDRMAQARKESLIQSLARAG